MTKQKNQAVDKEQYKHYLIDEVETLKKESIWDTWRPRVTLSKERK